MLALEGKGTTGIFLSETVVQHICPWLPQFCCTRQWSNCLPFLFIHCNCEPFRYSWQFSPLFFVPLLSIFRMGSSLRRHFLFIVLFIVSASFSSVSSPDTWSSSERSLCEDNSCLLSSASFSSVSSPDTCSSSERSLCEDNSCLLSSASFSSVSSPDTCSPPVIFLFHCLSFIHL